MKRFSVNPAERLRETVHTIPSPISPRQEHHFAENETEQLLTRKLHFHKVRELEATVSMIQTAEHGLDSMAEILAETHLFLENLYRNHGSRGTPSSVLERFLQRQLWRVNQVVQNTKFDGKHLLNGSRGVTGIVEGHRLFFIRGSEETQSSDDQGYPVIIHRAASKSVLIGYQKISSANLRNEELITLFEGSRTLHYALEKEENPDSLIHNLQHKIWNQGLDVRVFLTRQGHLGFLHNQFGSQGKLKGMSDKTQLISPVPGQVVYGETGNDIRGEIGEESAWGTGAFLIGESGNQKTDGLVLYYDGEVEYPGQQVGIVKIYQNSFDLPESFATQGKERMTIPCVLPEFLGRGISNPSRIDTLKEINGQDIFRCIDSMRILREVLMDIAAIRQSLAHYEEELIQHTLEIMRSSFHPIRKQEKTEVLCRRKAERMAGQLKDMLSAVS